MCNVSGIIFGTSKLFQKDIEGKRVLEAGSLDVNGSLRLFVESHKPIEYIGVDIADGRGVDEICDVEKLEEKFGNDAFDLVIATELLEHVKNWRSAISNIKSICKPEGIVLITTRSKGFQYHAWPDDYWRFERSDMEEIFSDFEILELQKDSREPGIFLKAKKPLDFKENNLVNMQLHSIITGEKEINIQEKQKKGMRFCAISTKARVVDFLMNLGKKHISEK